MPVVRPYIRVSSEDQHESGLGEEGQRRQILSYWEHNLKPKGIGWWRYKPDGSPDFYEDPAESAWSKKFLRKEKARQLFNDCQPGDYLIVAKMDRAFRGTVDCLQTVEDLELKGCHLICLDFPLGVIDTSDATKKYILTLLAAGAELESGRISERTIIAKAICRLNGYSPGSRNHYGFLVVPDDNGDNKLIPNPVERKVLEYIAVRYHLFDRGTEDIAKEIWREEKAGRLPTTRQWTRHKVRRAVQAFWRIIKYEGTGWIESSLLKRYAEANPQFVTKTNW